MEKLFKLSFVLVCILFTVSCKTVIEEEKKEEIDFDMASLKEMVDLDTLDDFTKSLINAILDGDEEALMAEIIKKAMPEINKAIKEQITVFPNPTSSSATIKIDFSGGSVENDVGSYNFKYDLIFDEKIIYQNETKNISQNVWQEVIPEHLLQKSGLYIVAYEFILLENGQTFIHTQNAINFMVIKKQ